MPVLVYLVVRRPSVLQRILVKMVSEKVCLTRIRALFMKAFSMRVTMSPVSMYGVTMGILIDHLLGLILYKGEKQSKSLSI